MTENPPSWYTASVPWAPVKQPGGSDVALNLPQLDQQQLDALRQQLLETILRAVLLAVQQIALPGPIGSAFAQLTQWAGGVNTSTTNWSTLFSSLPGVANVGQFVNFLDSIGATGLASLIDGLTTFVTGTPSTGVNIDTLTGLLNNPVGTVQQWLAPVLNPAGVLTSTTQFPAYLLSSLAPGTSTTNLMPDPWFTQASQLDGVAGWTHSTAVPSGAPAGAGSAQVTPNGTLLELEGVMLPVSVAAGDITASITAFWQGLTATGQAIALAVNSYTGVNADGTPAGPPIGDPTRIIATITNPAASSPAGGQVITGQYQPPAGTKYATMVPTVLPGAAAGGPVRFTGAFFQTSARIDAAILGNIGGIPTVPGLNLEGFQGLQNLPDTFGHMVDGLGSSFAASAQSGLPFPALFSLAQSIANSASSALGLATTHQQVITNVTNFPLTAGLDPTAESTFDLQSLPHGSTLPTTTVASGATIGGPVNIAKGVNKGFLKFYASIAAASTGVYVNAYKINPSTGTRSLMWGSTDIASQIPTSIAATVDPVTVLIPGGSQPLVSPSDLVHLEIVNQSANTLTVVHKQLPQPTRATGILRNFGMTRITGGSVSPTTIADSVFTYSGIVPWLSFGVSQVPANYWPPVVKKIVTPTGYEGRNAQANQPFSYTLPTQFRPGVDYVDYVIAPAGGGGDSGSGGSGGPGGTATLVVDGVTYSVLGTPGGNAGGALDSGGGAAAGKGLGSTTYNGQLYQAGGDVGAQAWGSVPGGSGGGGAQFVGYTTYYGRGGPQGTWVTGTLQPTGMTLTGQLGYGGVGQNNYAAGSGADAGVWIRAYQNPAVP